MIVSRQEACRHHRAMVLQVLIRLDQQRLHRNAGTARQRADGFGERGYEAERQHGHGDDRARERQDPRVHWDTVTG